MDMTSGAFVSVESIRQSAPVELDQVHPLIRLLGEPNRLRIFALLTRGERCVCDIEAAMTMPQNLVSHHLRVLREAGLIEVRREGRWAYYRVNKTYLAQIYPILCSLFDPNAVSDARAEC
ncbi:MAG: hypothetical protein KatS3mg053_1731 [Candidatus Roseilinea sp.]|nr:MAG: hypothetical protein KatS3mg053_1731 [Candidatus Roseilinea sp.]